MVCDGGLPYDPAREITERRQEITERRQMDSRNQSGLPLHVWHGTVLAYTGRGYDWANRFKNIVEAAKALPVRKVIK
jgi:hypothetical protein